MIDLPEKKVVRPRTCNQCGATWPYHYLDCPTDHVPGGVDLYEFNERERLEYENEKKVPREQGVRILKAIFYMVSAPNHKDFNIRKEAVLKEIGELNDRQDQTEDSL